MRSQDIVAGAAGGLAAGAMMAAMMMAMKRAGMVNDPLPEKVERWAEERLGDGRLPSPGRQEAVGQAGHLAASAALGAAYGMARPEGGSPLRDGLMFGAGLYAVDVAGIGPVLGIVEAPTDSSAAANARRLAMHLMFGIVTAALTWEASRRLS